VPPATVRLKDLTPEQYAKVSQFLDHSLELTPAERAAQLAQLEGEDAACAAVLRELESARSCGAADGFLATRDLLLRNVAALAEGDSTLIGKRFGPYRVLSLIGRGGMGSVWLAERIDGLFSRQVALKLVASALSGEVMSERLAREREIVGSLSHPNIARLLDAGFAEDGQPYLALEYIPGLPLSHYCDQERLSVPARLTLFRQVLGAVQYAHAHAVIHRDLKPSNILVTADGQAHLLDFGIAKLLHEGEAHETQLTQLGGRALTPDYAAPEQIAGASVTTAADVYALGVILYELLCGQRPYRLKRDSRGALEEAILQAEPQAPSRAAIAAAAAQARATTPRKLAKALRGDLDTITLKALKKRPAERYATADAFSEDLGRYERAEVVLAQPDSVVYRAAKFTRRHWVGMAVTGALIVTLALGLGATSYEARRADRQRDAALQAQLRSLTQTGAARLRDGDVDGAMGIILEVLPRSRAAGAYAPEALSVFQEARAAAAQVMAIAAPTGVWFVAFSPDGSQLVTALDDKTARVYDSTTGTPLLLLRGHGGRVWTADFSPDGWSIITASADKTARIWDAVSGRQRQVFAGHASQVARAVFSPDGRQVATASDDKTARLWEVASGRELRQFVGHEARVTSVAFSPDGRRLASASADLTARVWDVASGRELARLRGHTDRVFAVSFSPDGQRVLTAADDRTARVWDAANGRELLVMRGHTNPVDSAVYSPDGSRVVTGSTDRTARVWDAATGEQLQVLHGHRDRLEAVAFSPDGRRIATASDDGTTRLWNAAPDQQLRVLAGHSDRVTDVSYSADGSKVASTSDDNTARVWDAASGAPLMTLAGHTNHVYGCAFSPDGQRLLTASADKTARIWDLSNGRELMQLSGHSDWVASAAYAPDGTRVATASYDKSARIWDAASGALLRTLNGHSDALWFVGFSPDGRRVVTASRDKTVRIWDAASGQPLEVLSGHTGQVLSALYSTDGRRIVSGSDDLTARIWDAASGAELMRLVGHEALVNSAMFSPDGRRVVTSSDDKTVRLWDAATAQQLQLLGGHTDHVSFAAFSPDGRRIASSSDDRTVRIWDAQAPALATQLSWAAAAQFEPLSGTERFQLGLVAAGDVRQWPASRSACDAAAAAPDDPQRRAPGVSLAAIATDIALPACASGKAAERDARRLYQEGRALMAAGSYGAALARLQQALGDGYAGAALELAQLLSDPQAKLLDPARAVALYQRAYAAGVAGAAFGLGQLYEQGVECPAAGECRLAADAARAWDWYGRGAAALEPRALARLAERATVAARATVDETQRTAALLEAFRYYATAAERARREDWPDEAWRSWRYQRASLAHLLASRGALAQTAAAFEAAKSAGRP
jgi:WD40 repeat protein/serine/threonine protein kinase